MKEIQKYLQETLSVTKVTEDYTFQDVRPRIVCNDGESVSIQAGRFLYSSPREDGLKSYSEIEAGFPSVAPPDSWLEYAEDHANLIGTVYAFMPIEIAQEFIDAHGGIDWDKSLEVI